MTALPRTCLECGGTKFVEDRAQGDVICRDCGVVAEAHTIDERSEWRTFSEKDKESSDPNRTGGPSNPLLGEAGMSTTIGKSQGTNAESNKLNRLHTRSSGSTRSLQEAYRTIGRLCTDLNLSQKVKDGSMHLYKQLTENPEYNRSHGLLAMCCACVYMGSKLHGEDKTFKDITAVAASAKKTDIGRCYQNIHKFMQEQQQRKGDGTQGTKFVVHNKEMSTTSVKKLLPQFANQMQLPWEDKQACVHMADQAEQLAAKQKMPWDGKSPPSIAAAILYIINLLSKKPKAFSFQDLFVATGVAEVTIKHLYKDFYPHVTELLPAQYMAGVQLSALVPPT